MKQENEFKKIFSAGVFASGIAVAVIGYAFYAMWRATPGTSGYTAAQQEAREYVAGWGAASKVTALAMIERYGAPEYRSSAYLLWGRAGPWKRTVVHNVIGVNTLEQAVDYQLTPVEAQRVNAVGHGLRADTSRDEIVTSSNEEALDFLAANMADEVVMGKRTPQEAAAYYAKTADLAASGKSSMYMKGLLFTPAAPGPKPMYGRGLVY